MPKLKSLLYIALHNKSAALFALFNILRKYSFFEYNLLSGKSFYPDFITFELTKGCNYKCSWCSSHSQNVNLSKNELTTQQWYKIIDQVKKFKPAIYLCGGEPTLRKDYLDIIKYIKKKGLVCAMTTNASTLTENKAKELVQSGIDFISISLDGDKDTHNLHRGDVNAYSRVVDGVSFIKKYRAEGIFPHIKLVGVINPNNPKDSLKVLEVGEKMKVDEINFGHLMYFTDNVYNDQKEFINKFKIGSAYITGANINDNTKVKINEIKDTIYEIKKHSGVKTSIAQGFALDVESYYSSFKHPSDSSYCLTPWFSAKIRSDGSVSPCMEFDIGNIKNNSLLELWNSKSWCLFRRLKKSKQQIPACFRCGEGQKLKF